MIRGRQLASILALCFSVYAQEPVGTLEGQIEDKSGGAISGATVSARNLATGYSLSQVSSEKGFYRLAPLPVGSYVLKVESQGFGVFTQEPIHILVSQTARVDIPLELATISEAITVSSDANQLDLSTNTLGKTVSGREVLDLPLNGPPCWRWIPALAHRTRRTGIFPSRRR